MKYRMKYRSDILRSSIASRLLRASGRAFIVLSFLLTLWLAFAGMAAAQGELRFCLRSEPKTFDPLKVEDDASVAIRYLTGGVLVRMNRQTQALEPELAESWKVSKDGKQITFKLRSGISFSDGTPFSAEDVAYTMQQLMDPALHSPTGDAFRSGPGNVETKIISPTQISITFPAPVAGLDRQFDQVAILSEHSPKKEMAVLGPFMVADYKAGTSLLLKRNPNYWKSDAHGRKLPYLDSIRLDIQPNRDVEMLRFKRGEIDLINSLDSEYFDKLAATNPQVVHDAGASLDSEQMWFNEVAKSPLPAFKKNWFRSATFRRAISQAINRADLARVVFRGHAQPAVGPVSPANKFWFNANLKADSYSPDAALKALQREGFRLENGTLKDKGWKRSRVFHHHQRGQQISRAHGHDDSGRPAEDRDSGERRHARLPFPDRAHDADLRLRSHPARPHQRRTRPQRADERVAEFVGESPVESVGEGSGNRMGSGDRQADAGAGFLRRCQEAEGKFRSRAGDRGRAGAIHFSGESQCAVGRLRQRAGRKSRDSCAPDLLECGTAGG